MKTWLFCIALTILNNVAFATPSIRDAYGDEGPSDFVFTLELVAVFFVIGWIMKIVTKTGTVGENAGFALMFIVLSFVGIAFVYGMGRGLYVIAQEYPILAILIVAFYAYAWKRI